MDRVSRGQVLVEAALVMPILLFVILGGVEAGYLVVAKADQDRATQVVADWAAQHPGESWNSVANHELPHCTVEVSSPFRDVVEATSECPYRPTTGLPLFDRLTIGSRESAASATRADSPSS